MTPEQKRLARHALDNMGREDDYATFDHDQCGNCEGEGFVFGCAWDWQCDTWDGDSCLCQSRCDWCNPWKPADTTNPREGAELALEPGESLCKEDFPG